LIIETLTFRLTAGADEAAFLRADRRVQTEFIPNQPGFSRRTTARSPKGEWIIVVLWSTEGDAEAAAGLFEDHPATQGFASMLDGATARRERYSTLE